jgi:Na+:H+ antiporter, NhaA family
VIEHLKEVLKKAHSPLHSMEHALVPYVAFRIMPASAFFSAGIAVGSSEAGLGQCVSLSVFLGLVLGKPIGVTGFALMAVKSGLTRLPAHTSWSGMIEVGMLARIGLTMSLFIASLAFADRATLDQAKIGVLAASVVAAA